MFYALMGRFQLELIYYFTYFSTVVPSSSCVFLSCRSFIYKTCQKCRINDERPTGKKNTTVGWDDGGKIGKIIIRVSSIISVCDVLAKILKSISATVFLFNWFYGRCISLLYFSLLMQSSYVVRYIFSTNSLKCQKSSCSHTTHYITRMPSNLLQTYPLLIPISQLNKKYSPFFLQFLEPKRLPSRLDLWLLTDELSFSFNVNLYYHIFFPPSFDSFIRWTFLNMHSTKLLTYSLCRFSLKMQMPDHGFTLNLVHNVAAYWSCGSNTTSKEPLIMEYYEGVRRQSSNTSIYRICVSW